MSKNLIDSNIWWNRLASLSNELIRINTLFILEGDSLGVRNERKVLQKALFPGILNKRESNLNEGDIDE